MSHAPGLLPMPPYPWQQSMWAAFVQKVQVGRIPHAMLLHSPPGVGIESLARAMAQYVSCLAPTEQLACGKCKSCLLNAAASHPDVMLVEVEEKATQIKIDQIRLVAEFLAKTSQQGGRKVVVIEAAEAMNGNAANALLKSLEEPAGDALLILTSSSSSRLLPTIRSRCLQVALSVPGTEQALAWLISQHVGALNVDAAGASDAESGDHQQQLTLVADLLEQAVGAPLRAKQWWDNNTLAERKVLFDALVKIAGGQQEPMVTASLLAKTNLVQLLDVFQFVIDRLLAWKMAERSLPHSFERLQSLARQLPVEIMFRFRDRLAQKRGQLLLNANLNAQLVVEELVLDWAALCELAARQ